MVSLLATLLLAPPPADEAAARMSRGVALLEQFRFADAAAEFQQVVEMTPDAAAAHVNLGIAWFNERDFAAARAALLKARDLDPASPHAHYNLGLIDKLEGDTEAALAAFDRVVRMDPNDSMAWYYLGSLQATAGRLEEAEQALRRAILLTPEHESAHFSLGNVLIRAGRREEGRVQLQRFQEIKETFAGAGVSAGLQYTELGPYAEAVEPTPPSLYQEAEAPEEIGDVPFREATADWGLSGLAALPAPETPAEVLPRDYSPDWAARHLLPDLGSGVAFRDLNADGLPELVFVRGGDVLVFRNTGSGFQTWEDSGVAVRNAVSVSIGDVDLDGAPDLYVAASGPNALYLNRGGERFERSEAAFGNDVSVGATLADFDHDGDLDILVANYAPASLEGDAPVPVPAGIPGAENRLFRNNQDGAFTDVALETRTTGGARRSLTAIFSDWDDDRDVDFLVVNDGAPVQVFSNDRIGAFTEISEAWGVETAGRMRGVASGDFDRDGRFDLAFTAQGGALNMLLRRTDAGFQPDAVSPGFLGAGAPGGRYGVSLLDADRDMDLDLLLAANEPGAALAFYWNTPRGFVRAGGLDAPLEEGEQVRALALADVDADGDLDALTGTNRGRLVAFRNEIADAGNWMAVVPTGLRSNRDGIGTKVEVRAAGVSQRREMRTTSGYLSQDDLPVHFGLGEATAADYVRFLWPGGVKQIELDLPASTVASVEELNRKGTSCPVLYAWDGERIRFVTDFLGGSALGNLLAPGVFNTPDTAEVVKLESFPLVPRDGHFELRWLNQLEEVIFYDRAALWIADHPEDWDVFPDERLMPGPPYPEPGLVAVRNRRPPSEARSAWGNAPSRDRTAALRRVDRIYVEDFPLLPFKGYAEEHALTLRFDDVRAGADHVLLLHGWVDYADSSSNLAASQAGVQALPPVLEIEGADGEFRAAVQPMGFPAGLPKTMVVPLDGVPLASGRALRIRTNMRIYWDRAELAERAPLGQVAVVRLDAAAADFRFAGYPEPFRPAGRPPGEYRYRNLRSTDTWGAHAGAYTRYGDVLPLLDAIDDRYVIARHGDEIRLRFEASAVSPAPAPGRRRAFFVFADGFGKDMDLNSARPHTVGPLPFHGMPGYPYPEGAYPDSPALARWRAEYNTREIGPEARHGFLEEEDADVETTTSSPRR